jgi:hypothetical protein
MKEYVQTISDFFTDPAGQVHHFTIAAITVEVDAVVDGTYDHSPYCDQDWIDHDVTKGVKIGISICNPSDKYDLERGVEIATGRARKKNNFAFFITELGFVSDELVETFLEREANYLINNPERYIVNYNEIGASEDED